MADGILIFPFQRAGARLSVSEEMEIKGRARKFGLW